MLNLLVSLNYAQQAVAFFEIYRVCISQTYQTVASTVELYFISRSKTLN